MVSRPTSVTVIGWLLLIFGILALFGSISTIAAIFVGSPEMEKAFASSPIPLPVQCGMMLAGTIVQLVCGYFMLQGRNWSRYLYVGWSAIGFIIGLATTPMKLLMIPSGIVVAVIVFFLFRPAASLFFIGASGGAPIAPASIPSARRIISVVFYIAAGFLLACTGTSALMVGPAPIIKPILMCFFIFPFAVCLVIGKWSAPKSWKLDMGVTTLAGALFGLLMAVAMSYTFSTPEFRKSLPPERIEEMKELFSDYTFAAIWFGGWTLLGAALVYFGWNPSPEEQRRGELPPIVGR